MELWLGYTLIVARLAITGWVWTYRGASTPYSPLLLLARVITVGFVANLLPILVLATLGFWTPLLDWSLWIIVALAGLLLKRRNGPLTMGAIGRLSAMLVLTFLVACPAVIMPHRSEWLAGGWDPGLYVNNAIAISQRNGLEPLRDTLYADMSREGRLLFSASEHDYREIFPGVPINIEDGSLPLYFFHLTPSLGSWVFRAGGFDLLFRLPVLLACWGLVVFLGFCAALDIRGRFLAGCAFFWCINPVWWYQQSIPTSEMMYVLLMMGGLLFYLLAARRDEKWPVGAMLCFMLATINHFNFPLFAGLILLGFAVFERFNRTNNSSRRVLLCAAGVVFGILFDMLTAGVTLSRLEMKDNAITIVTGGFMFLLISSLVAYVVPIKRTWGDEQVVCVKRLVRILAAGLFALGIILNYPPVKQGIISAIGTQSLMAATLNRIDVVSSFLGVGGFFLVAWGLWVLSAMDNTRLPGGALVVILILAGMLAGLLVMPGIASTYPWGLRRFVPVLLPLVAIAQAGALTTVFRGSPLRRLAGSIFLFWGVWSGSMSSLAAARVTDYLGIGDVLSSVSQKIAPGDIVIVDDPRYGTPLQLTYGHDVINGQLIWSSETSDVMNARVQFLAQLSAERNGRLLWLTTDEKGIEVYPKPPDVNVPPIVELDFGHKRLLHHPQNRRFVNEYKVDHIKLFEQQD